MTRRFGGLTIPQSGLFPEAEWLQAPQCTDRFLLLRNVLEKGRGYTILHRKIVWRATYYQEEDSMRKGFTLIELLVVIAMM